MLLLGWSCMCNGSKLQGLRLGHYTAPEIRQHKRSRFYKRENLAKYQLCWWQPSLLQMSLVRVAKVLVRCVICVCFSIMQLIFYIKKMYLVLYRQESGNSGIKWEIIRVVSMQCCRRLGSCCSPSFAVCSLSRYLLSLDDPLEHLDRDLGLPRHRPRRPPFHLFPLLPVVTRWPQRWPVVLVGLHCHHHERVYRRGAPLGRRLGRCCCGRERPLPLLLRPALNGGEAPPLMVDPPLEDTVVDELLVLLVGGGEVGGGRCVVFIVREGRQKDGGKENEKS